MIADRVFAMTDFVEPIERDSIGLGRYRIGKMPDKQDRQAGSMWWPDGFEAPQAPGGQHVTDRHRRTTHDESTGRVKKPREQAAFLDELVPSAKTIARDVARHHGLEEDPWTSFKCLAGERVLKADRAGVKK